MTTLIALALSLGVHGTSLWLRPLGEGAVGGGVHASVDIGRLGIEAEYSVFPEDPSGYFGERLWMAGVRARVSGPVYLHARAGRIRFEGDFLANRLSADRHRAYDVGVTYERSFGRHALGRIGVADVIIPFGDTTFIGLHGRPERLGTKHNMKLVAGMSLRF